MNYSLLLLLINSLPLMLLFSNQLFLSHFQQASSQNVLTQLVIVLHYLLIPTLKMVPLQQELYPLKHFSSFDFILIFIFVIANFQQLLLLFLILTLPLQLMLFLVLKAFHCLLSFLFPALNFNEYDHLDLFFVFKLLIVLVKANLFYVFTRLILVELLLVILHIELSFIKLVDFLLNIYQHLIQLIGLLDLHLNELNAVILMFKLHLVIDSYS